MLVAAAYENLCRGCGEQITELGGIKKRIAVGVDEFPMGVAIVVDHQEIARLDNHRELAHEFKRLKPEVESLTIERDRYKDVVEKNAARFAEVDPIDYTKH
ncbi:MAG: hypothetical protein HQ510_13160 [Candidatus Marinimicrobia bacterium]|nr:hypothetical protein [Candidatus Neomarinimicrobiota bacterium]